MATVADLDQTIAGQDDTQLPMFEVQNVNLLFEISADFVAAQVANSVLILALSTGRILRFDLDSPSDVDDIDLPKRPAETGVIRKLFLDPSASHLIISTTLGDNYYLHTQSRQPKLLNRLKGVQIECIAWNASRPTASTREILIGAADGHVYETYIEPNSEFYKSQEKYFRNVYNPQDGPIIGVYADLVSVKPLHRRVLVATQHKLLHFVGRSSTGRSGYDGSNFSHIFEHETPAIYEIERGVVAASALAISPDAPDETDPPAEIPEVDKTFAWLSAQGILHGTLSRSASTIEQLGSQILKGAKLFTTAQLPAAQSSTGRNRAVQPAPSAVALTQFHTITFVGGRVIAFNNLNERVVFDHQLLEPNQPILGLFADHQRNTYWIFTARDIHEIVVTDEDRDLWRISLSKGQYDAAQKYAKTPAQQDIVAAKTGEYLISQGKFDQAAVILGKSSKPFEDVALDFIDRSEHDALRSYLLVKLSTLKRDSVMQRMMLASWLIELYMAKLNQLDDTISTRAEIAVDGSGPSAADTQKLLPQIRKEFQDFVTKNKSDLDQKTTYEIISAHGREEELLYYANIVDDYDYVLSYWVLRERWPEAMTVLKKQTNPDTFYKYSTVLISHVAQELVDILMRQSNLDPKKLIPALLAYNKTVGEAVPLNQNHAIRYLLFCINHSHTTEPAVHNTLISIYAAHPSKDETALLNYLETQSQSQEQNYDADFALRLCITHNRVHSAVHIYSSLHEYASAVDLALRHNETDLAAGIADSPTLTTSPTSPLQKKLWLKIARAVIASNPHSLKTALSFLRRTPLLRIEDLIPFFPDFIIIDDFKEEICTALEQHSRRIDALKREMDDSAAAAKHIQSDIRALETRYAIVEPGERCWVCRLPVLSRQFFVFPCQHAFHADCLADRVVGMMGSGRGRRVRELQREIGMGVVAPGKKREGMVRELDGLVAGQCVLCGDVAVRRVDEPFVGSGDDVDEWRI